MHKRYENDLRRSFVEACEAFPAELARFVFFAGGIDAPIFITPDIADELSQKTSTLRLHLQQEKKYIVSRNAMGMAYYPRRIAGVDRVKMIGLARHIRGIYQEGYTQEMRVNYVLDHEIGHHVVKNGMIGGHAGECRADAFATLRHIQRYGMDTGFVEMSNRSAVMVLKTSPIHYTYDVMTAVYRYARRCDITQLSLQQTAALAERIGALFVVKELSNISAAFGKAERAYRKEYKENQDIVAALLTQQPKAYALFCRETAKVMREHSNDRAVIKAGRRFLNYPPIKAYIAERAKISAEWKAIQKLSTQSLPPDSKETVPLSARMRHTRLMLAMNYKQYMQVKR